MFLLFKKALVGVTIAVAAGFGLLVPGFVADDAPTEVAVQSASPAAAEAAPALPTEIAVPAQAPAISAPSAAEPTLMAPAVPPTPLPTAVVIAPSAEEMRQEPVEPEPATESVPLDESSEDTTGTGDGTSVAGDSAASAEAQAAPTATEAPLEPTATSEPVVEPTTNPEPSATAEPTPEPTAEPTPTETPTPEPTATPEPTPEPTATAEPTPEPTATVEPTATAEPADEQSALLQTDAVWLYVDSTDGLFLREEPAGQITDVLTHAAEVHLTGQLVQSGERLWVELDVPGPGWVARSFLTNEEPMPLTPTIPSTPTGPSEPPSLQDWVAFRDCESGGRYDVVDPSGLYHGAYQFLPSTWDGLARRFWPELVGVLPSQAAPADQDKMAAKLFELEGASPWPTCGRYLL